MSSGSHHTYQPRGSGSGSGSGSQPLCSKDLAGSEGREGELRERGGKMRGTGENSERTPGGREGAEERGGRRESSRRSAQRRPEGNLFGGDPALLGLDPVTSWHSTLLQLLLQQ